MLEVLSSDLQWETHISDFCKANKIRHLSALIPPIKLVSAKCCLGLHQSGLSLTRALTLNPFSISLLHICLFQLHNFNAPTLAHACTLPCHVTSPTPCMLSSSLQALLSLLSSSSPKVFTLY